MDAPDSIRVEAVNGYALAKRRRRVSTQNPSGLELLPAEWRNLLSRWVKRGGRSRWETLRNDAGTANLTLAEPLLGWLLRKGWAAVIEERRHGDWWPLWLELRELPALRATLGLADKDTDARRWEDARAELACLDDDVVLPALGALDELPVHRALARCDLVLALHHWKEGQHSGTRRDFALFARDDTKAVTDAEWNWLESFLDLSDFGIERHTPLLFLSAPLLLRLDHGQIDLAASPDFAALTPGTVGRITCIDGAITHWHLLENRTSFERAARQRDPDAGVIWVPGFPPGWWQTAVARLLALAPARARISCDPDPAGIAIALHAGEIWRQCKLEWEPWKMGADELSGLSVRKALSELDRRQLESALGADALPAPLAALARWMLAHGEKGEQEGYL